MVDAFLIITALVMAGLLLFAVILLLICFSHPDDNTPGSRAWFPKIVTILGLWFAFASVLVLPYDVANQRGEGGGLNIAVLWRIIYYSMAIMLIWVVPYAFWYYESQVDPTERTKCCNSQAVTAFKYTLVSSLTFIAIMLIMYSQLRTAVVPYTYEARHQILSVPITQLALTCGSQTPEGITYPKQACINDKSTSMEIPVTFPVYMLALISFLGWFFFTAFAGVGLVALPFDLINAWRTRPQPMGTKTYFEERAKLGERASMLIEFGEQLKMEVRQTRSRKEKAKDRKQLLKFEQYYYFLKQDYAILQYAHDVKNINPLIPFGKLIVGILGSVVSLCWILQICLFILPKEPINPFLNTYLVTLTDLANGKFPLLGVLTYAIFSLWLMGCVLKGNFKLGVRFLIWKIYPLEWNNTLMNAFLFNTWMIMLTSIPLVQFCVMALPIYARETDIDIIFGAQAQYLKFFSYFWLNDIFVWIMMLLSFLTLVYLFFFPKDEAANIDKELNKMAKGKASDYA